MNLFRNNLILLFTALALSGCYKNEPIPTANFTYSGNNDFKIPCTVKFTNRSTNAFSYDWYFGNDSTSSDTNPSYTYVVPGKYLVELRAYTESRNEWASRRQEIVIKDTLK
ncbi:MAG: PKD domain-containing protein [Bacteroidales bacterium]|nr:PKD domain-containing protein [Bacteroidales bacterium]